LDFGRIDSEPACLERTDIYVIIEIYRLLHKRRDVRFPLIPCGARFIPGLKARAFSTPAPLRYKRVNEESIDLDCERRKELIEGVLYHVYLTNNRELLDELGTFPDIEVTKINKTSYSLMDLAEA